MPQEREACKKRSRRGNNEGRPARDVFSGESLGRAIVDAPDESVYSRNVPVKKIQVGQVWKKDDSGDTFLITKVYNEALTTFALLRKTGSESEPPSASRFPSQERARACPVSATRKSPTSSSAHCKSFKQPGLQGLKPLFYVGFHVAAKAATHKT